MLPIPKEMRNINAYIYTEVPSARDLYEKMGFRYVTGRGHNSVENAESSMACSVTPNAFAESLYRASEALNNDVQQFNNK